MILILFAGAAAVGLALAAGMIALAGVRLCRLVQSAPHRCRADRAWSLAIVGYFAVAALLLARPAVELGTWIVVQLYVGTGVER